jgi:transposase
VRWYRLQARRLRRDRELAFSGGNRGSSRRGPCAKTCRMSDAAVPPMLEMLRQLPRDLLVPADDPARFVNDFVDTLDLPALGFFERHRPNWRPPHPVGRLLKVVLFSWLVRIHSFRAMARACPWDLRLLYLCECDPPKRSSIGRFWRDHHASFVAVFETLVRRAAEAGLVGMDLHALDGTKMRAACSVESGLHRASIKKTQRSGLRAGSAGGPPMGVAGRAAALALSARD